MFNCTCCISRLCALEHALLHKGCSGKQHVLSSAFHRRELKVLSSASKKRKKNNNAVWLRAGNITHILDLKQTEPRTRTGSHEHCPLPAPSTLAVTDISFASVNYLAPLPVHWSSPDYIRTNIYFTLFLVTANSGAVCLSISVIHQYMYSKNFPGVKSPWPLIFGAPW